MKIDQTSNFYNTGRPAFRENEVMANTIKPIPEGFEGATPYLSVKGAADAIEFYKKAYGATETMRMTAPDGRIGHAEIKIGKANIMLADEHPEIGFLSPRTLGGSPVTIHIYVEDVDALAARAEAAGAKVLRPVADQFYGDRSGQFEDPFGHRWNFATHKEDVSSEEMRKRAAAYTGREANREQTGWLPHHHAVPDDSRRSRGHRVLQEGIRRRLN